MKKLALLGLTVPIAVFAQARIDINEYDMTFKVPSTSYHFVLKAYPSSGPQRPPVLEPSNDAWGMLGTPSKYLNAVYTASLVQVSDERKKEDIRDIDGDVLEKIRKIQPVTYQFKDAEAGKEKTREIGFLAQDLARQYPELVRYDAESDVYSVQYSRSVAVLVAALKEQQKIMERQANEINSLSKKAGL